MLFRSKKYPGRISISTNLKIGCKTYDVWLVVQAISGTIGILLVLGGLLQPIFKFVEMDMRPGYFFGLFTTNTYFGGLVRNAGFYDEPGALAFWGIYALIINKMFVKNTKIEILLIIAPTIPSAAQLKKKLAPTKPYFEATSGDTRFLAPMPNLG